MQISVVVKSDGPEARYAGGTSAGIGAGWSTSCGA
jgi:hypothetical protein